MSDFKKIISNVPIWEIDGNKQIKKYAKEIAEVTIQLKSLESELEEMNEDIVAADKRVNMYLSNVLGLENFEQSKQAIFVRENHKIEIYNVEDLKKGKSDEEFEDEEILLEDLPEPLYIHKSNPKQTMKILNQLEFYNDLLDDFSILLDEFDNYAESHKLLWVEVKKMVGGMKFLALETDDEEIESYSEEKHLLLIAQNSSEEWGFKYIRKEDEEKFNNCLSEQLQEDEIEEQN
ncbi:gp78 [Bacillus phage G]|uniref:Gp78 n=1 Tax=Bacillus phage G TaxID=2884420 RepID=G3MBE8_9CAUD|nr:gp78 [Bacillus phage G]AEO93349.1 gp78 [Bacillus phage G]